MEMIDPGISEYMPEKAIWAAVIEQAIHDFKRYKYNCVIRDNVITWFKNRTNNDVGSFIWICDILEMDPDKIAIAVLKDKFLSK